MRSRAPNNKVITGIKIVALIRRYCWQDRRRLDCRQCHIIFLHDSTEAGLGHKMQAGKFYRFPATKKRLGFEADR